MANPDRFSMLEPILGVLPEHGGLGISRIEEGVVQHFGLTTADRTRMYGLATTTVLRGRVEWALDILMSVGAVRRNARGVVTRTAAGTEVVLGRAIIGLTEPGDDSDPEFEIISVTTTRAATKSKKSRPTREPPRVWRGLTLPALPATAWLEDVRSVARRFRSRTTGGSSVYVALLHEVPNCARFSLYVGRTGLTPTERYSNHKADHKANRQTRDYGIGLLAPVFEHLNPLGYDESHRIEERLAEALIAAGYDVFGGH